MKKSKCNYGNYNRDILIEMNNIIHIVMSECDKLLIGFNIYNKHRLFRGVQD